MGRNLGTWPPSEATPPRVRAAGSNERCVLEGEPQTEANLPFDVRRVGQGRPACDAGDLSECAGRHVPLRVGEDRNVQDVPGFDSKLELLLPAHRERAERRQIEAVAAGAVELVACRVAEFDPGRLRKLGRIEPRAVRADLVDDLEGPSEVCQLGVARRVQYRAAARHRERVAAERAEDAVDLPVADDRFRGVAVAVVALPRQLVHEAKLQVVPAVEPGRRPVAPEFAGCVPRERRPAVVVAFVHRFAERVRALAHEPVREGLVERDLQRVVLRFQTHTPGIDRNGASDRRVRPAVGAGAEDRRRVDVQRGISTGALRPDVRDVR